MPEKQQDGEDHRKVCDKYDVDYLGKLSINGGGTSLPFPTYLKLQKYMAS